MLDELFPYLPTKIAHFDWLIRHFFINNFHSLVKTKYIKMFMKKCLIIQSKSVILLVGKEKVHLTHDIFFEENRFRFVKLMWL